jgi:hypothetical protein
LPRWLPLAGQWQGEAERFRELENRLAFSRDLHWKVGRLGAFEDAINVAGCEAALVS